MNPYLDDPNIVRTSLLASISFYRTLRPQQYEQVMRAVYPDCHVLCTISPSGVNKGGIITHMGDYLLCHMIGCGESPNAENLFAGWTTLPDNRVQRNFSQPIFNAAFRAMTVLGNQSTRFQSLPILVFGHSAGGAVSRCMSIIAQMRNGVRFDHLITFGEPCSLHAPFAYSLSDIPSVRVINRGDCIPRLPYDAVNLTPINAIASYEERVWASHYAHFTPSTLFGEGVNDNFRNGDSLNDGILSTQTLTHWALGHGDIAVAHGADAYADSAGMFTPRTLLDLHPVSVPFVRSAADRANADMKAVESYLIRSIDAAPSSLPEFPASPGLYVNLGLDFQNIDTRPDPLDEALKSISSPIPARPVHHKGLPVMSSPQSKIGKSFRPKVVPVDAGTWSVLWMSRQIAVGDFPTCKSVVRRLLSVLRTQGKLQGVGMLSYSASMSEFLAAAVNPASGAAVPAYGSTE